MVFYCFGVKKLLFISFVQVIRPAGFAITIAHLLPICG